MLHWSRSIAAMTTSNMQSWIKANIAKKADVVVPEIHHGLFP